MTPLKFERRSKNFLQTISKKEQTKLGEKRKTQQDIVSKIKKQGRKYKSELKKKQRAQEKINSKIAKIISDAIAKRK